MSSFPVVDADPGVTRQVLADAPELMVVAFRFEEGAMGKVHSHPHIQSTYVESGRFRFTVDGTEIEPRRAFGATTAFDIERAGVGTLEYRSEAGRSLLLVVQVALWIMVLFAATRVNLSLSRRGSFGVADETLIDLDGPELSTDYSPGKLADPGLDVTSPGIERPTEPASSVATADPDHSDANGASS